MKARLNRNSVVAAVAKRDAEEVARKVLAEQTNRDALRFDTIMCAVLHEEFGFGYVRLLRFLKAITDAHLYTLDRYGRLYQDSAYAELLRRDGIDMNALEGELEECQRTKGMDI